MNSKKPTVVLLSGKSGCVDCDTEFFNGIKWKKISDYDDNDLVLQYNEDGTANLVKPIDYIKQESDFLYEFNNTRLSMCLSEDHECYYLTNKNNLYHKSFKEIMKSHINSKSAGFQGRFITSFKYGGSGINLSDDEIKLMCAVICDSSFIKDTDICFFNLKKERKQNELRNILKNLNYEYKEFKFDSMPGYIRFKFKAPRVEKEFTDFWYNCNNHQLQVICDNIYKWDGHYHEIKDSITFTTTNINTANFIQFAYSACGYRASIYIHDRVGNDYSTNNKFYKRISVEYEIHISKKNLVRMANGHINNDGRKKSFNKYKTKDGYEYCFTVPSHMLVLRRNNKIFITGNCGKDYIANIMKQQLEDKNNKVLITHYADLLKYILKTFFNWNGEKDENGRALLQRVGTNVIREKNPNYWTDFINDILDFFPNEWDYILIPDTRFPNEIEEIKKNYNVNTVTVRIDRPNYKSKLTEEQQRHASETALDNYRFDYHLFNTGTDKIIKEVEDFICIITKFYYKRICFIDMDCTVFNTVKCITELYDEDFKYYSDYKKIPWQEVVTWEFSELSAAPDKYIDYYFNQKRFFDKVEMYPNAKEVIDKLNNKYNIVFVSHGYSPNLRLKQEWVKEHFPYAEFIGVNLKHCKDKSIVDMKNGIFIDDTPKNLESSNADIKICYGDYEWNKDCKIYIHANNWKVIEDLLL